MGRRRRRNAQNWIQSPSSVASPYIEDDDPWEKKEEETIEGKIGSENLPESSEAFFYRVFVSQSSVFSATFFMASLSLNTDSSIGIRQENSKSGI